MILNRKLGYECILENYKSQIPQQKDTSLDHSTCRPKLLVEKHEINLNVEAFKVKGGNLFRTLQADRITSIACSRSCLSYLSLKSRTAYKREGDGVMLMSVRLICGPLGL